MAVSTRPLEDELVLLGRTLVPGPVPDVRAAVTSSVLSGPALSGPARSAPAPARRWSPGRRLVATVAALAVALTGVLVVSPAARAAAVQSLSFVGIELVDTPAPAPPGPGTLPSQFPATLVEARRHVRFRVLVLA